MATAHIRKRTNKKGAVSYQIIVETERDPITGRRNRLYDTVKGTKKQAEARKLEMLNQVSSGFSVNPISTKLADWMDHWLTNYLPNIADTTRAGYEEKIKNYITPNIGHIPINTLNADTIQLWVNRLQKQGLSPKTIRNAYQNLSASLKRAVILHKLPYNPCEGVVLPQLQPVKHNTYTIEESRCALNAAINTDMYPFVLVALTAGLRRGEMNALKWKDIDFANGVLKISANRVHGKGKVVEKTPKTAAGTRSITVGHEVTDVLAMVKADYDFAKTNTPGFKDLCYVFCKADGTPFHPDSLTKKWERFVKKNNLRPVRLHDLRHTNATLLIQEGVSPTVVQKRLGHSDITVTMGTDVEATKVMDDHAAKTMDSILLS